LGPTLPAPSVSPIGPGSLADRSGVVSGRAARSVTVRGVDDDLPPGMQAMPWHPAGVRLDGRWATTTRAFHGPALDPVEAQPRLGVLRSRTVARGAPRWTEPAPAAVAEAFTTPGGAAQTQPHARRGTTERRRTGSEAEQHGR
ncbi:MAG: hypothetical protein HOV79_05905, partial [Hamadaea sp.]|nr:hypothetical protein [Hamadaea sp.]